jgi:hypothetical protein
MADGTPLPVVQFSQPLAWLRHNTAGATVVLRKAVQCALGAP